MPKTETFKICKLLNVQKVIFSKINISHDLLCPSFCKIKPKNSKIIEFWLFFLTLPHTHWECQAAHKTHHFEWNDPSVPYWAERCVRKTNSQHCKSSRWYPVTLASVSAHLFKQQGRKRGEENCWLEVRRQIVLSDLIDRKLKTGLKFCRNASHIILGLSIEGCGLSVPSNRWKMRVVGYERKIG